LDVRALVEFGEREIWRGIAKLDKSAHVQLSSFAAQGKPVVLIFGSYT